jgi:hypothetical protein
MGPNLLPRANPAGAPARRSRLAAWWRRFGDGPSAWSVTQLAQQRRIEPAIGAALTASDNVNLAPSDSANSG